MGHRKALKAVRRASAEKAQDAVKVPEIDPKDGRYEMRGKAYVRQNGVWHRIIYKRNRGKKTENGTVPCGAAITDAWIQSRGGRKKGDAKRIEYTPPATVNPVTAHVQSENQDVKAEPHNSEFENTNATWKAEKAKKDEMRQAEEQQRILEAKQEVERKIAAAEQKQESKANQQHLKEQRLQNEKDAEDTRLREEELRLERLRNRRRYAEPRCPRCHQTRALITGVGNEDFFDHCN